jgi:hypothetical protein
MDDQDSNNQVITIEPEISQILGLQDDFDLDPDEYLQLVREKLVQYDFLSGSNEITDEQKEEQRLLATKVREIRGQKREGVVKYNTGKVGKKINVDSFFGRKPEEEQDQKKITDPSKLLPGTAAKTGDIIKYKSQQVEDLKQPEEKKENKEIATILKILDSILDTLKNNFKFDQKKTEVDRKDKEKKKREARESNLEKGFGMVKGAIQKMLAPFQNILDAIWRYIFFTFLGKMFTDLMNWLKDPKNKKKIEVIGRFLKDWWPLLLGAYLLFASPLGLFIKGAIKLIGGLTSQILKLLPRLLKLSGSLLRGAASAARAAAPLLTSPEVVIPATVLGAGVVINELTGQRKAAPVQAENKARAQTGKGLGVQGVDTAAESKAAKAPTPGSMGPTTPYGLLQGVKLGGIVRSPRNIRRYTNGAEVVEDGYSGVDSDTGISITGAGKDTQLIAARPGEVVLTPEDAGHIQQKTGFDVYKFVGNRKPGYTNFNKIKTSGGISLANKGGILGFADGGIVGGNTPQQSENPKINLPDYYSLLAISALEDDKPQGRADVAQSIYNRLLAANRYGVNFYQRTNSLKDLITAGGGKKDGGQYEPTFSNKGDWLNIKDKNSAVIAIMNSKKGRDHKWTFKDAMDQLNATESALRNPSLQSSAQKHVGGRAYFLGTSEQKNMKPGSGDVLRGKEYNYFSPWFLEGKPYDKERRNIASPIPQMLLPKPESTSGTESSNISQDKNKQNPIQNFASNIFNLFSSPPSGFAKPTKTKPSSKPPKRWAIDPRGWFGMQGGGSIMPITTKIGIPTSKMNIEAGADTQYLPQYNVAVQPGEQLFKYVIPKDAAEKGAGNQLLYAANKIIGDKDSNSNAAKIGIRNKSIGIKPYSSGGLNSSNITMLPPIKNSSMSGQGVKGSISGSQHYSFSPVLDSAFDVRKMNCDIYEIVD